MVMGKLVDLLGSDVGLFFFLFGSALSNSILVGDMIFSLLILLEYFGKTVGTLVGTWDLVVLLGDLNSDGMDDVVIGVLWMLI